jgi:hypothetical protein
LIDACRRLTSTAVEMTPDMAGVDVTSHPREVPERDEKNGDGIAAHDADRDLRSRRRSISHSYQDFTSDPEADAPSSSLHKRMDQLSRYIELMFPRRLLGQ